MSHWDDDWNDRGRGGPRGQTVRYVERERERDFLNPAYTQQTALTRTRSVGHAPTPNVQIYNYTNDRHSSNSRSPPHRRDRSRGRSPGRLRDDELLEEMDDLRREVRRNRSRSAVGMPEPPGAGYYQQAWQRDQAQQDRIMWERDQAYKRMEIARLRDRIARDDEDARHRSVEEQMKWRVERERLKDEAKAREDKLEAEALRDKVLAERDLADRKAKADKERAVKDWEAKHREEEEDHKETAKRAVEEYHRKQREAKEKEEELKLKFKLEEEKKKADELEQERLFEIKQAEKKAKKEKEEKEEKEKIEAEMHKRLAKIGFQENMIEAMLDDDAAKKHGGHTTTLALASGYRKPTYIKISTDHVAVETLEYYKIPYQLDPSDRKYIIILQEMSTKETDILFEHTRRLRKPATLFIEDRGRKNEPQLAFVRKKSKSRHRSKSPALRFAIG